MFKEPAIEKLIEYIQTLPEKEQRVIVKKITVREKVKKADAAKKHTRNFAEMSEFLNGLGTRLPKNYKFNREEANER